MEPLSALALACNVLDLVERGIKCSKVVYALYKDGSTDDQDDLTTMANTMETVVADLKQAPTRANVRKSALDPQISKLLAKSTALCSELHGLIKKCQLGAKGSLGGAGVALFRKLVHKSEIEALVRDLQTSRTGLAALLSTATQYGLPSSAFVIAVEFLTEFEARTLPMCRPSCGKWAFKVAE